MRMLPKSFQIMTSRHVYAVNSVERKQQEIEEEELAWIMPRFCSYPSCNYWLCILGQTIEFLPI